MSLKALLVGYGEAGKALEAVFTSHHEVDVYDLTFPDLPTGRYDVLLVAIPYAPDFVATVNAYREAHGVQGTIIFSTVAVGTTRQIPDAVHSPIEGMHPSMANSIWLMPRWVGGYNSVCHQFLTEAKFTPRYLGSPDHTEFIKLRSTARYAVNIEFVRYEAEVAAKLGLDYEAVKEFDEDYNRMWRMLKVDWAQRYVLNPPKGNLGGNCLIKNAAVLQAQYPSVFLAEVLRDKEGHQ